MRNFEKEFDRFSCDFDYVNFINTQSKEQNKILEQLEIGDVVKLNGVNYELEIQNVDFLVQENVKFDYAGSKIGDNSSDLILFNQKDIEKIISKKSSPIVR